MIALKVWLARVHVWVFGRRRESDLADEIRGHLELLAAEYRARGLSDADASRAARRDFGGVEPMKAAYQDQRGLPAVDGLFRDLRFALRALSRSPGFAIAVITTLALGMAATVAMFTVLNQVVLRPLPYPNSDRLVRLDSPAPGIRPDAVWNLSTAEYFYFRDHVRAFEHVAIYVVTGGTLAAVADAPGSAAERTQSAIVSSETLELLGAKPVLGRLFTPSDQRYDLRSQSPPVVILSYDLWQRRFGGSPDVVGRTVIYEDHPFPIVGVLPAGVELPETLADLAGTTGIWMPLGLDPSAPAVNMHTYRGLARLRPGAGVAEAQAELNLLTPRLPELFPTAYTPQFMASSRFSSRVVALSNDVLGPARRMLWVLAGAIGVLFLIAVSNIANLFLARAQTRRREQSLRLALGASGWHLFRYAFAEALVLCGVAAAIGVTLASLGLRIVTALALTSVPRFADVRVDATSLAAAVGVSLLAAVGFVALSLRRSDTARDDLREQRATASPHAARTRRLLVATQVALALVLTTGASLMARTVQHLLQVHPGFDASGVLTFNVILPRARYTSEDSVAGYYRDLSAALSANTNIETVSASTLTPLDGNDGCDAIAVEHQTYAGGAAPCVMTARIAPRYFDALRIRIRQHASDWTAITDGAVVSESLARRLWPDGDVLGKGIRINGNGPPFYRVAAVSDDVLHDGPDKPSLDTVYFPIVSTPDAPLHGVPRGMRIVIRTRVADAGSVMPDVRQTMARLDPSVPVGTVQTLSEAVSASMARHSLTTTLLVAAALLAMLLSAVGLYGVIAYAVESRRREIGVRIALGARPGTIQRMVLRDTLLLIVTGLVVGIAAVIASTRLLGDFLFGISPRDPFVLASTVALLLTVGLLAGIVPAWRASRIAPLIALQCE